MQECYELLRNLARSSWWVSRETQVISNIGLILVLHCALDTEGLGAHVYTQARVTQGLPQAHSARAPGPQRLLQSRLRDGK